jgi:RNA polymerase sigma-70 factor (ECF subfamily)
MSDSDDFARLLAEARAGSREALGRLLEACRRYLLLIAERDLGDDLKAKGGASDLVQQSFLEAQQDFPGFRGGTAEELRAWLRQLLRNNLANFTRTYRDAAKRGVDRERPLDGPGSAEGCGAGLTAATPSPSAEAVANEDAAALARALQRLPEDYRQAITLRHQEQLSFEEIGRRLGRTANAARLLWLRAVERLQEEMGAPSA